MARGRSKPKSIKSSKPSLLSKAKNAAVVYGKNVAGGAKIVAGALANASKTVGGKSQTGAVLNAKTLPGAQLNPRGTIPVASGAVGSRLATAGVGSQAKSSQVPGRIIANTAINRQTAVSQANFNPILGGGNIQNAELNAGATGLSGYEKSQGVLAPKEKSSNASKSGFTSQTTTPTGAVLGATDSLSSDNFASLSPSLSSFGATTGQSVTGTSGQQGAAGASVITVPTLLGQNKKLEIQELAPEDFSKYIPAPVPVAQPDETLDREKAQKDLLDYLDKGQASEANAYKKAQRESGILESQKLVNELTGQLNQIVNQGQAQQLSLVGQGRGIPEAIIGGQQAEIGRQTAINALPVQAQLSAAQGNLEMAQSNLETLFKIYSNDAKNKYERKLAVKKAVYEFASEKEKKLLEKQDKEERRALEVEDRLIKNKEALAIEAAKKGAPASVFTKIAEAPDFASALKASGSYLKDVSYQKLANGDTVVVDGQGRVISSLGGGTSTENNYIVTNDVVKDNYGGDLVGLIAQTIKKTGAKQSQSTNDAINVISGLQQLVKGAPNGQFVGVNPLIRTPDKFTSPEGLTNRSNIEAVNLKVQQWASGASLTEQQTKQVAKLTPQVNDTDVQIRSKVNALANYMISQVSGQLAGQGVGFSVDQVDLFTKTPEQELSELYKDPIIRDRIRQATELFPSYTDAEILQIITI